MTLDKIIQQQKAFFAAGTTKSISWRLEKLEALYQAIRQNETDILNALKADLGKAHAESYACEVGMVLTELRHTIRHLKGWARPRRVPTPLMHFPAASRIYNEPYGMVLIMAPWNYPFLLSVGPVIGAVSAGNCFVLKPSEYSVCCSSLLKRLLAKVFNDDCGAVILGGPDKSAALLNEKFDYIFFTGSIPIGKIVMEAAAKHLTPVSLELGGKSPCIVDETADISLAAKRIVWGKFLNAGQTCVAPDYLYVHASVKDDLLKEIKACIRRAYGENPLLCGEYPKIISGRHYGRLMSLIAEETPYCGGKSDDLTHKIAPTVLDAVTWDSPIMQEEIFGPVLPVLTFQTIDEALSVLALKEKPLALYLFTASRESRRRVLHTLSYGGGCVNDTILHLASPHMPFGGVGASGMGGYHGKYSFDTFSHKKGILTRYNFPDFPMRFPPYGDSLKLLKRIMK